MRLPFTIDQFLDAFRRYNDAVWPAQWVLIGLAVAAVVLALRNRPAANRAVSAILALLWLWMAIAYQFAFFTSVSRVGVIFAAAFTAQGLMLAWLAFGRHVVTYRPDSSTAGLVGAILMTYGLVAYPLLGYALGHRYPEAPTFGVPCPTTIFTLGLVVWSNGSMPWRLLGIPLAWAVVGTSAAVNLGMLEDFGLLAAAIATLASFVVARRGRDARRDAEQRLGPNERERWTVVY